MISYMAHWPVTLRPHCRRPLYPISGRWDLDATSQITGLYSKKVSRERAGICNLILHHLNQAWSILIFLEMTVSVLFKVGIEPELDIVSYKLEIQDSLLVGIVAYGATGPITSYKKTASL
jgi:hypothetical protein